MAGDPPGGSGHSGSPGASGSGVKKCPRQTLVTAYKTEPAFKQRLEKHNMKTMFNASWDDCNGRFLHPRDFSAGLATAFHNTTSVESDFSILKWEFSGNRKSLSNLSLGGIFQTKQREALSKLLP